MPNWTIATFTHRGRVRPVNEDAIAVHTRILTGNMDEPLTISMSDDCCVLMIADGMGGQAQGALASRAALAYLVAAVNRLAEPASCAEVIEEANRHLFELMHQHQEALGMGSTIVGVTLKADQLVTFNVGDSRAHLFSKGQLIQLSRDDVPEQESHRPGLAIPMLSPRLWAAPRFLSPSTHTSQLMRRLQPGRRCSFVATASPIWCPTTPSATY